MNEEDDMRMNVGDEAGPRDSEESGNQKSITESNMDNEFDQDDDDDDEYDDKNWSELRYLNEIDSLLNGNQAENIEPGEEDTEDDDDDDEEGLNFDAYLQEYISRFEQQTRHHHHHRHRRHRHEFGEKKRKSRRSKRHKHLDHRHVSQHRVARCKLFKVSSRSKFLIDSHKSNLKNIEFVERKGIEAAAATSSQQAANEEAMANALANLNDNEANEAAAFLVASTGGDSDSIRSLIEQMELRSEQLQQQEQHKADSSKNGKLFYIILSLLYSISFKIFLEEPNEQAKTSKSEDDDDEELVDYNYGTSSILSSSAAMSILEHNSAATALISTMLNSASSIQILIDIIKRQAATLAEAKVFDRVSLTSSVYNFNDYESNGCQATTSGTADNNNNNGDDNYVDMQHSSNENDFPGDESMDDDNDDLINNHSNQARAHFSFSHSSSSLCSDSDDNSDSYSSYSDSCSSSYSSSSATSSSSFMSSSSCSSTDDAALINRRLQRRDFAMLAGKSNKKTSHRMTSRNRELLLERVANMGSSPIAVLQAIAAKALNLKLKNSKMASTSNNDSNQTGSDLNTLSTTNPTETQALAKRRRRRLLRHYKFLKSSNIAISKQVSPSTSNSCATTESVPPNSNSQTRLNSEANSNNNNSSSSLFSVLRFWMNKRSMNSNSSSNSANNGSKSNQTSASNTTGSTMITSTNTTSMLSPTSDMSTVQHTTNFSSSHELPPPQSPNRTLVSSLLLPNLQNLSLRNLGNAVIRPTTLNSLLSSLTQLKYLDLTNCCTGKLFKIGSSRRHSDNGIGVNLDELQPWSKPSEFVGCLSSLASLSSTLHTLLMSDLHVEDIQANLKYILRLKNLVKLDVSSCKEKPNMFKNPSLLLAKLAFHLRKLNWLDISGTNICGSSLFKEEEEITYMKKKLYEDLVDECNDYERVKLDKIETIKSGIAGLMFLNNEHRMLDFLGCFSADNSIGSRQNIPARRVASESSEKDLFCALEVYAQPADRALFLLDALNHLFELYRDEFVEDRLYGGYLIMNIMEKHLSNARIQISGSASLFYVLKYLKEENVQYPTFYLKRLITTVLNGMEEHIDENAVSLIFYFEDFLYYL